MNAFITAQGFAKMGMYTVLIGAAANIILDPIFIFALGMGVRGAALATVLSQGLSCAWVLVFLCGKKAFLRLRRKKPLRLAEAHPAVRGARPRNIHNAGERERHLCVLQRFPAQVRRRHRRRRHDDPHERDAVCHAAAAGHRSGRTADHKLQLRRKGHRSRARNVPSAAEGVPDLLRLALAAHRALPLACSRASSRRTRSSSPSRRACCASTARACSCSASRSPAR